MKKINIRIIVRLLLSGMCLACSGFDFAFCIKNFYEKEYWNIAIYLFLAVILFKSGIGHLKVFMQLTGLIGRDMEQ